jgi:hypothetical protein
VDRSLVLNAKVHIGKCWARREQLAASGIDLDSWRSASLHSAALFELESGALGWSSRSANSVFHRGLLGR